MENGSAYDINMMLWWLNEYEKYLVELWFPYKIKNPFFPLVLRLFMALLNRLQNDCLPGNSLEIEVLRSLPWGQRSMKCNYHDIVGTHEDAEDA